MVSARRPHRQAILAFAFLSLASAGCRTTRDEASEDARAHAQPETSADLQRFEVRADDGHALVVWSKLPEGRPKGAMVLVHGRTWSALPDFDLQVPTAPHGRRSLMDQLRSRDWAVYAVDLRGYGETARDASGWLEPSRAAKDLDAVLAEVERRHEARPVVIGWSNGALVAQLAVQMSPERVRALVLYGYPRDPDLSPPPFEVPSSPPRAATTAEAAASDFITEGAIDEEGKAAFVAAALKADPVRVDWRRFEEWNSLDARTIRVPVLLVRGEDDPIATADIHARLDLALSPSCKRVVTMAGTDHAAHLEHPERFVEVTESFLADCVDGVR